MTTGQNSSNREGYTVVITNRVRRGEEAAYDEWLQEIGPLSRKAKGILDWQIIRPVPGVTSTYTVILRFDTMENLDGWIGSEERRRLIEKVRPLLENEDRPLIHTGLDFWFVPQGTDPGMPVRWKQFLVTWTAIYPLVLGVPIVVIPVLRFAGLPPNRLLDTVFTSAVVTFLMGYVVMPRYTRAVRRWLYR